MLHQVSTAHFAAAKRLSSIFNSRSETMRRRCPSFTLYLHIYSILTFEGAVSVSFSINLKASPAIVKFIHVLSWTSHGTVVLCISFATIWTPPKFLRFVRSARVMNDPHLVHNGELRQLSKSPSKYQRNERTYIHPVAQATVSSLTLRVLRSFFV